MRVEKQTVYKQKTFHLKLTTVTGSCDFKQINIFLETHPTRQYLTVSVVIKQSKTVLMNGWMLTEKYFDFTPMTQVLCGKAVVMKTNQIAVYVK